MYVIFLNTARRIELIARENSNVWNGKYHSISDDGNWISQKGQDAVAMKWTYIFGTQPCKE